MDGVSAHLLRHSPLSHGNKNSDRSLSSSDFTYISGPIWQVIIIPILQVRTKAQGHSAACPRALLLLTCNVLKVGVMSFSLWHSFSSIFTHLALKDGRELFESRTVSDSYLCP